MDVLHACGLIDDALKTSFDRIRTRRNRYLHVWSSDHGRLPGDAVECFRLTLAIVVSKLAGSIRDGALVLDPRLLQYLRIQGVVGDGERKT